MPDITFTRGYGFPRGSGMDYAGYRGFGGAGGFGGMLVNNQRRRFAAVIPVVPEPGIFAKIPALDGMDEGGAFGTEYDMTLPTLDLSPGAAPVEQQPGWGPDGAPTATAPASPMGTLGKLALAAAAVWFFTR